ncbi:MAG: hypothetical protein IKE58_04770 [Blautia sp.]|nr:hypothetical protein [Blautia sp.]
MDTPIIASYYKETDPIKRRNLLEQSIAEGEEPEENEIRKEIYGVRYRHPSGADKARPADEFLGLWMFMEYSAGAGGGMFGLGSKRIDRELQKKLKSLKIREYQDKGGLHAELYFKEICHMVRTYMILCEKDHSYNSTAFGILRMSEESSQNKLRNDIRNVVLALPRMTKLERETEWIAQAATEVYEEFFPHEGGLKSFLKTE